MNMDFSWESVRGILLPILIGYGIRALGVLALLAIAWLIAGWVRRMVLRTLERARFDQTLTRFFASMSRWLVLLLAVLACLGTFGVQTTSFAAILGAAGLAIGLAFQGTLSNFASGVMLLVFRPFKVGDIVTTAGQTGTIYSIDLVTTTLDTFDNRRFIIPNSAIIDSVIENISHHPLRRVDVSVGVDYSADIDQTRDVLASAAAQVPGALEEPAPAIVLLELSASSVNWSVRVWSETGNFGEVKQATIRAIKLALDEAGIGIPFPQLDVHVQQQS